MTTLMRRLWLSTAGASAAEYALILAIVGAGIAAAAYALGESIALSFGATGAKLAACADAC